jgi:peptidoglycan/LPS O-acetylase OafA/YrhL
MALVDSYGLDTAMNNESHRPSVLGKTLGIIIGTAGIVLLALVAYTILAEGNWANGWQAIVAILALVLCAAILKGKVKGLR